MVLPYLMTVTYLMNVMYLTQENDIRLWAQNLNVLLLCNPVTTQWCSTRGQMSHNVSKSTKLL